jgi:predicted DNA-binding transcriptional regulator AlpA
MAVASEAAPKTQAAPKTTYDSRDIRAYLKISETTLAKWIREGVVPPPMNATRRAWRWDAAAFDEWARSGMRAR